MQYMGGKVKVGKAIAEYINTNYKFQNYCEPFCGMLGVGRNIKCEGIKLANDSHYYLIKMLRAVAKDWLPPWDSCDEATYHNIRTSEPSSGLEEAHYGFIGHACTFGGRWWGSGYARDGTAIGRNFYATGKRGLVKLAPLLRGFLFSNLDYSALTITNNTLVYCDPPYKNTCSVGDGTKFDSYRFWEWARLQSKNNTVLISEVSAPSDFEAVWELKRIRDCRSKSTNIIHEKIFKYKGLHA